MRRYQGNNQELRSKLDAKIEENAVLKNENHGLKAKIAEVDEDVYYVSCNDSLKIFILHIYTW